MKCNFSNNGLLNLISTSMTTIKANAATEKYKLEIKLTMHENKTI